MCRRKEEGFTLIELLVVVSIIGVLSTMAVASYQSVRMSSRDVKRVSDLRQIQVAIELYFEAHSTYPYDREVGVNGVLLGLASTKVLSDSGFGAEVDGTPYMIGVPRNPSPGGVEYVYRSINKDGTDCNDVRGCDGYALLFSLEKGAGNFEAGPHALTTSGSFGAEGGFAGLGIVQESGEPTGLSSTQETIARYAEGVTLAVSGFVDDERVETVAAVAAPVVAVAGAANAAVAVQSASSIGYFFLYFLAQPFLLLRRRKRGSWGVVYDAYSKLPVDLAIVRLRNTLTGQVVKSAVTDAQGRFSLLVRSGAYRMEVAKEGIEFPSRYVDTDKDGKYEDVYRGEVVNVTKDGALLSPSIPVDPIVETHDDATVVKRERRKRTRQNFATIGPGLAAMTFGITPNAFTGALLLFQVITYFLFRRLALVSAPAKNWGIVYEKGTGRPVPSAVLRIFETKYNKLLESQVSDKDGRYYFRVGSNSYYLTATKVGYEKTESDPLDLTSATGPTVISANIPMRPIVGGQAVVQKERPKSLLVGPDGMPPTDANAELPSQEHHLPDEVRALRAATRPASAAPSSTATDVPGTRPKG